MKVFASGSCRLVTTIKDGFGKITPIHSMFENFSGINFMGKLHNTKQHIQFIKFIKDEIELPNFILPKFLTSYSDGSYGSPGPREDFLLLPCKKQNIKEQFDECEWFIFEICSTKLYQNNGYQVQFELTNDFECVLQTEEDLMNDLFLIRNLVPPNGKILFQVHFRLNKIYDDVSKTIENREFIFDTVSKFCEDNENTYIYDPSVLIQTDHSLFDGNIHFSESGHIESFKYICNNYITKFH